MLNYCSWYSYGPDPADALRDMLANLAALRGLLNPAGRHTSGHRGPCTGLDRRTMADPSGSNTPHTEIRANGGEAVLIGTAELASCLALLVIATLILAGLFGSTHPLIPPGRPVSPHVQWPSTPITPTTHEPASPAYTSGFV